MLGLLLYSYYKNHKSAQRSTLDQLLELQFLLRIYRTPQPIFITRSQFWPSGIVVACVCVCVCVCLSVCVCVNHLLVCAITRDPFKLGSPNLDHRCKRPWLRSLFIFGGDWSWPSRLNLASKSKFTPFWTCPCHNSPLIEVTISKFGTKMRLSTVQILTNFGLDRNWSPIQFLISNPDQIELFMYTIDII